MAESMGRREAPKWEGALDPDVYATILAWGFAHAGRRVQVSDTYWDPCDRTDVHLASYEGTLGVEARSVVYEGEQLSHVGLRLVEGRPGPMAWMYPNPDWGDGPHAVWVNLRQLEDGYSRAEADGGLRILGPQGEQIYTLAPQEQS